VNLLLLEPNELREPGRVRLTDGRAAHLLSVLQVEQGQDVRVGLLDGPRGTGTVTAIDGAAVELQCAFDPAIPEPANVDLLLALPRPKVLRRLWAQIAALGVRRVILTNAERVERDYFDAHVLAPECYRPLLIEGLQQARDTRLPIVSIHRRFRVLVEDELDAMCGDAVRAVAHPGAPTTIPALVAQRGGERLLMAIGPEGGWNTFELSLLEAHGFQRVGMGQRTLRSDTACVALLAIAHTAMEEST
jgi:RsmE family RNA methyltransferase